MKVMLEFAREDPIHEGNAVKVLQFINMVCTNLIMHTCGQALILMGAQKRDDLMQRTLGGLAAGLTEQFGMKVKFTILDDGGFDPTAKKEPKTK
jgi:hypothetical protein